MPITICVTGTLSGLERAEARSLVEEAGHIFSERVTLKTDFLVAARLDTAKVRRASELGITIITQSEFFDLLELNDIDRTKGTQKRERRTPSISWIKYPIPERYRTALTYHNADGVITEREIFVVAKGELTSPQGYVRKYIQGIDIEENQVRTFRHDRILKMDQKN